MLAPRLYRCIDTVAVLSLSCGSDRSSLRGQALRCMEPLLVLSESLLLGFGELSVAVDVFLVDVVQRGLVDVRHGCWCLSS